MRATLSKLNDIFDRRIKLTVIGATAVSLFIALLDTAAIALVLPLVDVATGGGTDSSFVSAFSEALGLSEPQQVTTVLAITVVGLFVLKDVGAVAYSWWLAGFKAIERVNLQTQLLDTFLRSPYTLISRRSTSDMIRSVSDAVTQVFGTAVFGLMSLVANAFSIAAILAALFITAPEPTLVVIAFFGAVTAVYLYVIKPIAARSGGAAAVASMDGWRTAFAALGGIKELNLRGTQHFFVERFREASLRGAKAGQVAEFLGGLPRFLLEILFIVAIGVFLVLSTSNDGGASTVGVLSLFVAAGFRLLPSVTGLLGSLTLIRYGATYLDIVHDEALAARAVTPRADGAEPPLPYTRSLVVEDVSFAYPDGDREVISQATFSVPHGSSFAFVGGSGAGKTTLADLLLGLHDPHTGRILVDGVDIAADKRRWQRTLGYVPQDVFLLDATLAENIAFDQERHAIDEVQLWDSIHQAQLEELVAELPMGVDTPMGERGARLSGGQKQRVGIARALYRQPELLVLDEATSALDNETEHRITKTIIALHGSITVIVIAHRLSTIRHCDQIVFLKEGRVDGIGTFDELEERSREFARLVRLGSLTAAPPDAEDAVG